MTDIYNLNENQTGSGGYTGGQSIGNVDPALFKSLISNHPFSQFNENYFLDLLEHSLSLSVTEKKRVIDSISILSQYQITELIKVFEDERVEFRKLFSKEIDTIRQLTEKAERGWIQLYEVYTEEQKQIQKQEEEQSKIDDLKKSLGV